MNVAVELKRISFDMSGDVRPYDTSKLRGELTFKTDIWRPLKSNHIKITVDSYADERSTTTLSQELQQRMSDLFRDIENELDRTL